MRQARELPTRDAPEEGLGQESSKWVTLLGPC
jgi:hypothetical protein